jgi:hypothetical protein
MGDNENVQVGQPRLPGAGAEELAAAGGLGEGEKEGRVFSGKDQSNVARLSLGGAAKGSGAGRASLGAAGPAALVALERARSSRAELAEFEAGVEAQDDVVDTREAITTQRFSALVAGRAYHVRVLQTREQLVCLTFFDVEEGRTVRVKRIRSGWLSNLETEARRSLLASGLWFRENVGVLFEGAKMVAVGARVSLTEGPTPKKPRRRPPPAPRESLGAGAGAPQQQEQKGEPEEAALRGAEREEDDDDENLMGLLDAAAASSSGACAEHDHAHAQWEDAVVLTRRIEQLSAELEARDVAAERSACEARELSTAWEAKAAALISRVEGLEAALATAGASRSEAAPRADASADASGALAADASGALAADASGAIAAELSAERAALAAERERSVALEGELAAERASLAAERDKSGALAAELAAERASLTAERTSLTTERASLTAEHASIAAERASQAAQSEALRALQASASADEEKLSTATLKLMDLQDEKAALEAKHAAAQSAMERAVSECEAIVQQVREQSERELEAMAFRSAALKRSCDDAHAKREAAERASKDARNAQLDAEQRLRASELQVALLRNQTDQELAEQRARQQQLEEELRVMTQAKNDNKEYGAKVKAKLMECAAQLAQATELAEQRAQEVAAGKRELAQALEQVKEARSETSEMANEAAVLGHDLDLARRACRDLEERLLASQAQAQALAEQRQRLEAELSARIAEFEEAINVRRAQYDELKIQIFDEKARADEREARALRSKRQEVEELSGYVQDLLAQADKCPVCRANK